MDLFMEWKNIYGIYRFIWDNAIVRPLVFIATLLDHSSLMRFFSLQTVSIGYKPKLYKK